MFGYGGTDYRLHLWDGASWSDTVSTKNIAINSVLYKSPLDAKNMSDAEIVSSGGEKIKIDSGGIWHKLSFIIYCKVESDWTICRNIIDFSQKLDSSPTSTYPYFRLYSDYTEDNSYYHEVHLKSHRVLDFIGSSLESYQFNFVSINKELSLSGVNI